MSQENVETRGRSSGAQAEMGLAMVTTFRAAKIVRVRFYFDRAQALEAVGLRDGSDAQKSG